MSLRSIIFMSMYLMPVKITKLLVSTGTINETKELKYLLPLDTKTSVNLKTSLKIR